MLLLSSLHQFNIPLSDFLTILSAVGLALLFLLAALCMPALCVVTEGLYLGKRKAFYDKCAMQMAQAGFGVALGLTAIAGTGVSFIILQTRPELFEAPLYWRTLAFFAPPVSVLILSMLYLTTWQGLKKARPVHMGIGLLAAVAGLALLLLAFLLANAVQEFVLPEQFWQDTSGALGLILADFLSSPILWAMFAYTVCTGIASAAGIAQLWLIMRRNRADYGRDYYIFAMRYCARWALFGVLAATACAAGVYWLLYTGVPEGLSQYQDPGILLVAGALPLCCALLWFSIGKSETPLRHKPGAFFALFFLFIALCAQILFLITAYPTA